MIKVLIIEDDFRIAEINRAFVEEKAGYKVVGIALNGNEALKLVNKYHPDLILLDVYIPDISGEELYHKIKNNNPEIDVIMITAAKEVSTLEYFLRNGIFDYLIKPVRIERLHHSLDKFSWMKQKLAKKGEIEQKDVDRLLGKEYSQAYNLEKEDYPKGIDRLTLEKVKEYIYTINQEITADELGEVIGISRSTARRYLEYLAKIEEVETELRYGTVGRPERNYRKAK